MTNGPIFNGLTRFSISTGETNPRAGRSPQRALVTHEPVAPLNGLWSPNSAEAKLSCPK